jgi:hypothetical protein
MRARCPMPGLLMALLAPVALADVQTFNDPGAFLAALQQAGLDTNATLTFEQIPAGTTLTFGQPVGGYPGLWQFYDWRDQQGAYIPSDARVTDYFPTHSAPNSLGLPGAWGRFLPGDRIAVFHGAGPQSQVRAVGVVVVTTRLAPAGAISLITPQAVVANTATPFAMFGSGESATEGHFLGVLSDQPIIGFEIGSAPLSGVFAWTADTLYAGVPAAAIPATSTLTLGLLAGVLVLAAARLMRRRLSTER